MSSYSTQIRRFPSGDLNELLWQTMCVHHIQPSKKTVCDCVLAVYEAHDQAELVFEMSSCRIYGVDMSLHLNLFV